MCCMGRGGGQVVSVLAFNSYNPSSNPGDVYSFLYNMCFEKNKKEAGVLKKQIFLNGIQNVEDSNDIL